MSEIFNKAAIDPSMSETDKNDNEYYINKLMSKMRKIMRIMKLILLKKKILINQLKKMRLIIYQKIII